MRYPALKAQVRLRRWRFWSSSEALDPALAPELPLAGGESAKLAAAEAAKDDKPPPRLMSVDSPCPKRMERRAFRELPEHLPRIVEVHEPESCQCPQCGEGMRRLGEDASEQLDYVPGYFRVIRHLERTPAHPINRIEELLPWRVGVLPPHRALSHAA